MRGKGLILVLCPGHRSPPWAMRAAFIVNCDKSTLSAAQMLGKDEQNDWRYRPGSSGPNAAGTPNAFSLPHGTSAHRQADSENDGIIASPPNLLKLLAMSFSNAKVLSTEPLTEADSRWIKLVKINYQDAHSSPRAWESAERRTRPKTSTIDAVGIVALIPRGGQTHIVLQKQYRAPVDRVCIEVPAGLVDADETAEEAALRELREETGYVGTVDEASPIMFNDPGFCNTNLRMVHVSIDPDLPENRDPKPQLEDDEFIECFTVPLATLWDECQRLELEGYAIDARVCTLAEGILLTQRFKL
ncbi:Nudix hydrolase [Paramyrothecium foliicola]|nr:Nudix hydrolase [Paramyrothecium foliicola]